MGAGQLVQLESFTLWEAMGATEIMDPKMDSGLNLDKDLPPVAFCPFAPKCFAEIFGIMIDVLRNEATWLSRGGLAQTLYTCQYFHHAAELLEGDFVKNCWSRRDGANPSPRLDIPLVATFVLATIKTCELVQGELKAGNIYEDEDAVTTTYGLHFYEKFAPSDALALLARAEDALQRELFAVSDTGKGLSAEKQSRITSDARILLGILSFLRYRKNLLLALNALQHLDSHEYDHVSQWLQDATLALVGEVNYGVFSVDGSVSGNAQLAVRVEEAFDPLLIRRLAIESPPKPGNVMQLDESLDLIARVMRDVGDIVRLMIIHSVGPLNISHLEDFLGFFSSIDPLPVAYARSLLSSTISSNIRILNRWPIAHAVRASISELCGQLPASLEQMRLASAAKPYDNFISKTIRPFVDLLKVRCHNRPRQRRLLAKLVPEWDVVQDTAASVDTAFEIGKLEVERQRSSYFASWALYQKLRIMEEMLLLGMDLELYGQHEFDMIFWYAGYILAAERRALEDISGFPLGNTLPFVQFLSGHPLKSRMLRTAVLENICVGTSLAIAALKRKGAWPVPAGKFDSEEERFRHRFKVFLSLSSPEPLPYWRYVAFAEAAGKSTSDVLGKAAEKFSFAKDAVDSLLKLPDAQRGCELLLKVNENNLQALMRLATANAVFIRKISAILGGPPVQPPAGGVPIQAVEPTEASLPTAAYPQRRPRKRRSTVRAEFPYHRRFPVMTLDDS